MGKVIGIGILILCLYVGQRHLAAAQACKKLADVPTDPQGNAGLAHLRPSQGLEHYRQPGRHTVFIFSAKWCPACRSLEAYLPHFLDLRGDVAIRMISIDDPTEAAQVLGATGVKLRTIPHVVIYGADGERVAEDSGSDKSGLEALRTWMNAEFQKQPGSPRS